ncbi:hypothetical protein U1Q18_025401, partial [Sarracenia purpurea var. burkii]
TYEIPFILRCWDVIRKIKGCTEEIQTSFNKKRVSLGPTCCKVITGMTERCFIKFFTRNPYTIFFGLAVKFYCSIIVNGRPPLPPHRPIYSLRDEAIDLDH